jgi:hypothetical protein
VSGLRWTRLEGEPIWAEAVRIHRRRFTRVYHDWDRVLRLYQRAGTLLNLPYDRALDLAILAHSAQIDLGGDRRARSVAWLKAHGGPDEPVEAAGRLILNGPYRDLTDPRLPLLELSDLGDPEMAERAVTEMIEQVRLMTRLETGEVVRGVMDELARIRRALGAALPRIRDEPQRALAEAVIHGSERVSRNLNLPDL